MVGYSQRLWAALPTLIGCVLWMSPEVVQAEPVAKLRPQRVRPGDMFRVWVVTPNRTGTTAEVSFMGNRFVLTGLSQSMAKKGKARRFVGYVAVPVEAEAGQHPVRVQVAGRTTKVMMTVSSRRWQQSSLSVKPKFTAQDRPAALQARLDKEQQDMAALWTSAPTYQPLPSRMCQPLRRMRVTGSFGTERVFNGLLQSRHYGTDYRGKVGVPVRAVMDGRVVLSAEHFVTGGTVVVDHGRGLFSLYFHLSKRAVSVGQRIRCRQQLGRVGQSGRVTGPHLHLSVVVRAQAKEEGGFWGMYVEPEQVLRGRWGRLRVEQPKKLTAVSPQDRAAL
ncbi:MAG: M23 family metallopeptidase [Myxococcales bacterium]|nr:M23 family metallopeptidase [Myxococcales bacterium]